MKWVRSLKWLLCWVNLAWKNSLHKNLPNMIYSWKVILYNLEKSCVKHSSFLVSCMLPLLHDAAAACASAAAAALHLHMLLSSSFALAHLQQPCTERVGSSRLCSIVLLQQQQHAVTDDPDGVSCAGCIHTPAHTLLSATIHTNTF